MEGVAFEGFRGAGCRVYSVGVQGLGFLKDLGCASQRPNEKVDEMSTRSPKNPGAKWLVGVLGWILPPR